MTIVRLGIIFWFVAIGIVLVACKSADTSTATGQISLEYVRTSESDVIFTLENGSSQTISVRGGYTFLLDIRVWPGESSIECKTSKGWGGELFGFGEGNPHIFNISPKDKVRLVIPTTFPQRYKGDHCRLSLMLKDGTIVGPVEFRP